MSGSDRTYKYGPKNHWRRTVWNDVLRRTKGREQTEIILYLAGPEDNDRKVALQKGVPSRNMIAIDRDVANVKRIRADGHSAVQVQDVLDALWSWPSSQPVCAVLLDYCGGLGYSNIGVYDAFQHEPLRSAVVMVNFLRGRDAFSNPVREALDTAGLLKPLWKASLGGDGSDTVCLHRETSHRAYQFLMYHAWDTWAAANGCGSAAQRDGGRIGLPYPTYGTDEQRVQFTSTVARILYTMEPQFYAYRSGRLVFDSAVFEPLTRVIPLVQRDTVNVPRWVQATLADGLAAIQDKVDAYKVPSLVAAIAATMAVRTRRRSKRET